MNPDERKQLWASILDRDPKLAKFLEVLNQKFGKPESVTVKFK